MAEAAKQHKAYDENSVSKAREKWLDARDLVQRIENGERSIYTLHEARQAVSDAEKVLEDAQHYAGHLAAAAQYRNQVDAQDAEHKKQEAELQKAYATESKAKFREEAKQKYLSAGGTEDQFNHAFPEMWDEELKRRTQSGHDTMFEKLKHRYAGARL